MEKLTNTIPNYDAKYVFLPRGAAGCARDYLETKNKKGMVISVKKAKEQGILSPDYPVPVISRAMDFPELQKIVFPEPYPCVCICEQMAPEKLWNEIYEYNRGEYFEKIKKEGHESAVEHGYADK